MDHPNEIEEGANNNHNHNHNHNHSQIQNQNNHAFNHNEELDVDVDVDGDVDLSSFPLLRIDELSKHTLDTLERSQCELLTMIHTTKMATMHTRTPSKNSNRDNVGAVEVVDENEDGHTKDEDDDDDDDDDDETTNPNPLLKYVTRLLSLIEREVAARWRVGVLLQSSSHSHSQICNNTNETELDHVNKEEDDDENDDTGDVCIHMWGEDEDKDGQRRRRRQRLGLHKHPSITTSNSTKEEDDEKDDPIIIKRTTKPVFMQTTKNTTCSPRSSGDGDRGWGAKKNGNHHYHHHHRRNVNDRGIGVGVGVGTDKTTRTCTTTTSYYIAGGNTDGGLRSRAKVASASIKAKKYKMQNIQQEKQNIMEKNKKERRDEVLKRMRHGYRRTRSTRSKKDEMAKKRDTLRRERRCQHEKDIQVKRDAVVEEMHRAVDGAVHVRIRQAIVMEEMMVVNKSTENGHGSTTSSSNQDRNEDDVSVDVSATTTTTTTVAEAEAQRQIHIVAAMAATKVLESAGVDLMEESDSGSSLASQVVPLFDESDDESIHDSTVLITSTCTERSSSTTTHHENESMPMLYKCNEEISLRACGEDSNTAPSKITHESVIMDDRDCEIIPNAALVSDGSIASTSLASGTKQQQLDSLSGEDHHAIEDNELESIHRIQGDECNGQVINEERLDNSMLEEMHGTSSKNLEKGSECSSNSHNKAPRTSSNSPTHNDEEKAQHVHDPLETVEWQPWSSTSSLSGSKPDSGTKKKKKYIYTERYPTFSSIFTACAVDNQRDWSDAGMYRERECLEYQIRIAASLSDLEEADPIHGSDDDDNNSIMKKMLYRTKSIRPEVSAIISDVLSGDDDPVWEDISSENYLGNCWNLLWTWSKPKLNPEHLLVCQRISRFQNLSCLTRKDYLKKRIERHYSSSNREQSKWNIMPLTFVLPNEYTLFVSAFLSAEKSMKNGECNLWILKPIGSSRGRGE